MSIGQWQPAKQLKLDQQTLVAYVKLAGQMDESSLADVMTQQQITDDRVLMKRPASDWQLAGDLSSGEVILLARFFTLAEQQLPGWEAGKDSPVIPLVKLLKARGDFDAELRKWIKRSTDNRYLPNGPL